MFSPEVDQPVGVYQNLGVSSKYRRYNELIHEAITLHNYELILRYSNHEIVTQKQKRKIFSPHWDLNCGLLETNASVLILSLENSSGDHREDSLVKCSKLFSL